VWSTHAFHLPVLLCGFVCGGPYGLIVGLMTPLLRSLLFGMPPLFPTALAMAFELASYGLLAGFFHRLFPRKILYACVSLVLAMIGGRAIWGIAALALYGLGGTPFTWQIFAAGKTTLARWLAGKYGGTVFHMDDYFLQACQRTSERLAEPGGNVDRERFREEVIMGLQSGKPFYAKAYDCSSMSLSVPVQVKPTRLSIVEGAYCLHPALAAAWDLTVFLSLDAETQSARILMRNGPERHKRFLEEWIPKEEHYFASFHIKDACDFILDGRDAVPQE